jgi:CRISPR-associated endonuclease Csn1
MNKVVCFASENQFKGQKTPKEAFESDEEKWNQIEHAIHNWYGKGMATKRDAFYKTTDDLDKDFIGSQLTDTRYISREALHYLKKLGVDVNTVKGQVTAWMRHIWGMNSLIDQNKTQKDRTDHRHHAIDAAVIACIDRTFYNTVVAVAKDLEKTGSEIKIKDLHIDPLFDDYRQQIAKRLDEIIIAHAPERKITGALHEDTGIGYIDGIGAVYRKNLDENFTANNVKNIIDPVVKELVEKHLALHGDKPKQAFTSKTPLYHLDGKTPIKRVRVLQSKATLNDLEKTKLGIKDRQGEVFKWMTLGNTHHVEIYQNKETKKYKSVFVTALEAKRRVNQKQKAIIGVLDEEHDFLFALYKNDLVQLNDGEVYRVQKLSGGTNQVMLRKHLASTVGDKKEALLKTTTFLLEKNELKPIKVNIIGKRLDDKENG